MSVYQVWSEGYEASGNSANAEFHGEIDADDFAQACEKAFKEPELANYFNRKKLTYWGCRLFDNEQEARKEFG